MDVVFLGSVEWTWNLNISSAGLNEVDLGHLSRITSSLSTLEHSAVNSSAARASDSARRASDAVLLHISVVRYSLEACKSIPPQQGMISAAKTGHLEGYFFGPIVLRWVEYHVECDFSRTPCLPTGNDSSEGYVALLDAAPVYFHFLYCILIDEV